MNRPSAKYWTTATVTATKSEVREYMRAQSPEQATAAALGRIAELHDDITSEGLLRRFVFCVSALHYHLQFGGLDGRQIKSVIDTATALIRAQLGMSRRGLAGDLLGELSLVRSQIERAGGEHFLAAWNLELSARSMDLNDANRRIVTLTGRAMRQMRLGNSEDVLADSDRLEALEINNRERAQICFMRAQIHRFGHQFDAAMQAIDRGMVHARGISDQEEALAFEKLLLVAQQTGNLRPVTNSVRARGDHFDATRFLEVHLLTKAAPRKIWLNQVATISTRARANNLAVHRLGTTYDAALCLENCYDPEIPTEFRLAELGEMLAKRNQLPTLQQELMFLAGAYAWLLRGRFNELARMIGRDYMALSQRASMGLSDDALSVMDEERHPKSIAA